MSMFLSICCFFFDKVIENNYYFRALVDSSVGGPHISKIVTSLTSGLSSLYDPQRITVAAFFSEVNT
jgi:hypothetical protein